MLQVTAEKLALNDLVLDFFPSDPPPALLSAYEVRYVLNQVGTEEYTEGEIRFAAACE
jgi:hypothetical protein